MIRGQRAGEERFQRMTRTHIRFLKDLLRMGAIHCGWEWKVKRAVKDAESTIREEPVNESQPDKNEQPDKKPQRGSQTPATNVVHPYFSPDEASLVLALIRRSWGTAALGSRKGFEILASAEDKLLEAGAPTTIPESVSGAGR